jgi:hypothetical protein
MKMRKIEQQLIDAINDGSDYWDGGNTTLIRNFEEILDYNTNTFRINGDALRSVYLHGNHIADIDSNNKATANLESFYHWPTATTRSRLRALGINASIKNFEACIDGVVITPSYLDWYC